MVDNEALIRSGLAWLIWAHPEAGKESSTRKPSKVVVTGDRNWTDKDLIEKALSMWLIPGDVLIHGAASGADSLSAECAQAMGIQAIAVTADWSLYGKAAGPIRNAKMLKEEPAFVLAFHDNLSQSKGTKDCVEKATKQGLMVFVHHHNKDGDMRYYVLRGGDL